MSNGDRSHLPWVGDDTEPEVPPMDPAQTSLLNPALTQKQIMALRALDDSDDDPVGGAYAVSAPQTDYNLNATVAVPLLKRGLIERTPEWAADRSTYHKHYVITDAGMDALEGTMSTIKERAEADGRRTLDRVRGGYELLTDDEPAERFRTAAEVDAWIGTCPTCRRTGFVGAALCRDCDGGGVLT